MNDPASSGHDRESELALDMLRPMAAHSESEIMYLVSPDHDILMLNAGFEGIWQRPATTFLGKKCYREIERRQEPCPHCPGVVALRTGTMSEAESYAVLDDGTRVPFHLRAYPLYGVNGEPVGFVETAEDISERRRFEEDARYEVTLVNDLLATSSTSRVLRLGLDAALRLEGAESGCIFTVDPATGVRALLAQRGLLPPEIESLSPLATGTTVVTPEGESLLVRVPVICGGESVAELAVRLSGDARLWPSGQFRLEAVAAVLASALARIKAERLRGDAAVNVQTIISAIPLAAFFLDSQGMVTVWNEASERMLGWSGRDALRHAPPFVPDGEGERFLALVSEAGRTSQSPGFGFRCLHRDGDASDVWFRAAPIHDVIGDGSSHLVIATTADFGASRAVDSTGDAVRQAPAGSPRGPDLAPDEMDHEALAGAQALGQLLHKLSRSLAAVENRSDGPVSTDSDPHGDVAGGKMSISWTGNGELDIHVCPPAAERPVSRSPLSAHALVIQSDEGNGRRLETILHDLGCSTAVCASVPAALEHLRGAEDGRKPPDLAIVDMVMPDGPSGLETAKLLTAMNPNVRVVVSSDHGVAGYTAHGFAAAISRPYTDDNVQSVLAEALGQRAR